MNITYNNLSSPSNLITFCDNYNILSVNDTMDGTKATITFTFQGNLQSTVSSDGQYYVTILGETVTNVLSPSNANNKRFFIASDNKSTAASFTRALRNCSSLAANFQILNSGATVTLTAKVIGSMWGSDINYLQRNISGTYLQVSSTDGQAYNQLFDSKVSVDIFTYDANGESSYITTLEKNFYNGSCSFDVSPVLATFTEYGKTVKYSLNLSSINDEGIYSSLGSVSGNSAYGYVANDSSRYIFAQGNTILENTNIDFNRYIYENKLLYTVMHGQGSGGYSITYNILDSDESVITSYTDSRQVGFPNYYVTDIEYVIPQADFNKAFYIDVQIGSGSPVRYNVIKPLKTSPMYQRVIWRNSYGGLSFFDFCGSITKTSTLDVETYEKNIYDYYNIEGYERERIYNNNYEQQVTLTSHILPYEGTMFAEEIAKTKYLVAIENGIEHHIIPQSVEVTENDTYNDLYTVSLTYKHSEH